MDTDLLKSTQEEQMAEMMLLMQMDKLSPEFVSGTSSDVPLTDFFGESRPGTTPAFPVSPHPNTMLITSPFHNPTSSPFPIFPQENNNNNWRYTPNSEVHHQFMTETGTGNDSGHASFPHGGNKQQMAAMREMIFRIAAMQPIYIDPESVKPPKRRNVKISKDPQSVAARHRRERISERIRILQRLVPGGTKMDTASMLDEAIHYVKFLKTQVQSLEKASINNRPPPPPMHGGVGFPVAINEGGYFPVMKGYPVMQSGEGSLQQAQCFSSDG